MACLSRADLERFAKQILQDFVRSEYPKGHLCYNVDPTKLAQFYGYHIVYVTITREGSVLGQFNSERTFKEHSFFLEELNEDCAEGEEYSDLLLQSYLDQFTTPYDALGEYARYWWLEELRDPRLVKGLAKLTDEDKELLTLIFVQQYTQKECAVKLHSSQSAISRRIARIIDVFTKK